MRSPARGYRTGVPRNYHPVMFARVSRIFCVSGSPAGRARSPRAMMSVSSAIASPSRPVA